jgi:hypothetical protein
MGQIVDKGGLGTTAMFLAAKNRCTDKAVCAVNPPHVLKSNLPVISVMVFHRSSLTILRIFSTFLSVRPVEGRPERSEFSTEAALRSHPQN